MKSDEELEIGEDCCEQVVGSLMPVNGVVLDEERNSVVVDRLTELLVTEMFAVSVSCPC